MSETLQTKDQSDALRCEAAHSPLPWHIAANVDNDYAILSNGKPITSSGDITLHDHVGIIEGEANAAYIVKACNEYPKLIEILKLCEVFLPVEAESCLEKVRTAIANAEHSNG